MYYVLFLIIVAICLWTALAGKKQYQAFAKLETSPERIKIFRRWILESWLMFGLFSIGALFVVGKSGKLVQPIITKNVSSVIPGFVGGSDFLQGLIGAFVAGSIVSLVFTVIFARRTQKSQIRTIGEFDALLPRNAKETWYGAAMSFAAGINEELFFRAAVPVVLLGLTHNTTLAIALSILVFGLGHVYQGWKGVLMTGFMGLLLTELFLFSGNIIIPMAFHVVFDLRAFVLLPWLVERSAQST